MTMLADQVDLVIGVDTHKHTNTAAVVSASTGGPIEEVTAPTISDGNEAILKTVTAHAGCRAWAIEAGTATAPAHAPPREHRQGWRDPCGWQRSAGFDRLNLGTVSSEPL